MNTINYKITKSKNRYPTCARNISFLLVYMFSGIEGYSDAIHIIVIYAMQLARRPAPGGTRVEQ